MSLILIINIEQTGMPADLTYEQSREWLRNWCCRHNATYYSAPKESFSLEAAREQAIDCGKNTVVVEDLS
jgi:predicted alpha/beta hydrolase